MRELRAEDTRPLSRERLEALRPGDIILFVQGNHPELVLDWGRIDECHRSPEGYGFTVEATVRSWVPGDRVRG